MNRNCNSYLDSSIHLAYVLLKMLEKWGKEKGDVYVRRRRMRAKNRGRGKGGQGLLFHERISAYLISCCFRQRRPRRGGCSGCS
jgi:hypothetical protein